MIDQQMQSHILASFDVDSEVYRDAAEVVVALLKQALLDENIQVHSITQRCKARQSLARKISKPDKNYKSLADVTDLAAIRVTTYFADDVDRVAELIGKTFKIDEANSIDKRLSLDPDRFGYQSIHFVAELGDGRYQFVEYKRFSKLKFEIQIRSVLQHAWAEIEHDLGYKSAGGIPREIRRRFSRVAGLLELADAEFMAIRDELRKYESEVTNLITNQPNSVELNAVSLKSLYEVESATQNLDLILAKLTNAQIRQEPIASIDSVLDRLRQFGISTVGELEVEAAANSELVQRFAVYWLDGNTYENLGNGIGLFYLLYVLLWKTNDENMILAHVTKSGIGDDDRFKEIANKIFAFKQN
ncbi:MAG: hypothetical protein PHQ60_06980 [Sideroxydans sp.]|nr:hypothetical protein [Sideroxydans sp.]